MFSLHTRGLCQKTEAFLFLSLLCLFVKLQIHWKHLLFVWLSSFSLPFFFSFSFLSLFFYPSPTHFVSFRAIRKARSFRATEKEKLIEKLTQLFIISLQSINITLFNLKTIEPLNLMEYQLTHDSRVYCESLKEPYIFLFQLQLPSSQLSYF